LAAPFLERGTYGKFGVHWHTARRAAESGHPRETVSITTSSRRSREAEEILCVEEKKQNGEWWRHSAPSLFGQGAKHKLSGVAMARRKESALSLERNSPATLARNREALRRATDRRVGSRGHRPNACGVGSRSRFDSQKFPEEIASSATDTVKAAV